jgi:uncharacterized protein YkwD
MPRFILSTGVVSALVCSVAFCGNSVPDKVRADILALTNKFRESQKKMPLKLNAKLAAAAQKHVDNMARQDKYGDDGENGHILDGVDPKTRVEREGYQSAAGAENVAFFDGVGGIKLAETVVDGWSKSPKHRDNMLSERFTEIGVGVARSKSGKVYFCEVFGRPK